MDSYTQLSSEEINPNTKNIDLASTEEILKLINDEDKLVSEAVQTQLPQIEKAVELAYTALGNGGRLIYVGAGTSGRLGILDASECPPTFGTPPDMVQAFIAGGTKALCHSIEGAEDDEGAGIELMQRLNVNENDVVVGITASGTAPYVQGAVKQAKEQGGHTVGLVTNSNTPLHRLVDVCIAPVVGPEVIMGSTRMKSGTAQKMVLNMISTGTMIKLGKVYHNLMVDLNAKNKKLTERAIRMVSKIAAVDDASARTALKAANGQVKTAVVMLRLEIDAAEAEKHLMKHHNLLREALNIEVSL